VPHILVAADADWVIDEVMAALGGPDTSFTLCRSGKEVVPAVRQRTPDLAVLDLQIGNMGGMAVTMALRLEETGGRLDDVNVLMLLDRRADLHLARRADADGWLVKPLDSVRLRRAATQIMAGGVWYEGLPQPETPDEGAMAESAAAESPAADGATAPTG
jgi:CheY-like chemotaxis protein